MSVLKKVHKCFLCKGSLYPVLSIGNHPLCDDLIKISEKKKNAEYPIEIIFCKNCIIAYQKYLVPKKILFPKNYHYRAKLTKDVLTGQKQLVKEVKKYFKKLTNAHVLDIGCNDGALLDFFKKERCKTIGVEPTDAAKDASKKHKIYNNYFEKKVAIKIKKKFKKIDIITFTNVFAHINDLNKLLKNLKILLSKNTIIVIENHYLGSILKSNQFDTFYHEHPRTYSLKSFKIIASKLNMNVSKVNFPKRYGGNIKVILSNKKKINNYTKILKNEKNFFLKFLKLKRIISRWKLNKKKQIKFLNKKFGPLPAKAFPGRAAILIKLLRLNKSNISYIYEQSHSKKINHFAPGSNIRIISDKYLKKIDNQKPIINFAWHIPFEIKNYLKKIGVKNKVIDIIQKKDII